MSDKFNRLIIGYRSPAVGSPTLGEVILECGHKVYREIEIEIKKNPAYYFCQVCANKELNSGH